MPSALMTKLKSKEAAVAATTGISITKLDPVPAWFVRRLRGRFVHDHGDGNFVMTWPGDEAGDDPIPHFETFVSFDFTTTAPCKTFSIEQTCKVYRFVRKGPGDDFVWYIDPGDPEGEADDPPPVVPGNGFQDPGEVTGTGGSGYNFYDIPGLPLGNKRKIAAERIRWVVKTVILCDQAVIAIFYWAFEITLPYDAEGLPLPGSGSSSVAQITRMDYEDKSGLFRKNHSP